MSRVAHAAVSIVHFAQAQAQVNCDQSGLSCPTGLPVVQASSGNVTTIIQIVFGVIGAFAVIIIIVAGIQFITSNGDPQGVARARQAIIYAAVGLAVAVSAEAIVTFVLGKL